MLKHGCAKLNITLINFHRAVDLASNQLELLKEVRIDGHLTQLFVDIERKQLLWDMAVATEAIVQIKALLALAEGGPL